MPEAEPLEIVFGAATEAEARLVAGLLESAGIEAVVLDENLTTYQIAVATATRGYRVAIPRSRRPEADEVLIENGYVDPDLQEDVPPGGGVCAKCLHTVLPGSSFCSNCGEPYEGPRA
ncbi:MAG: DUF2007 domain-containing protein [Elusimicrobia bacterium]|nr:DUF2007 domain-containing protein [Elusimicrobiota bacterium]